MPTLDDAHRKLLDAQKAVKDVHYNDAVFRAQEAVEFSIKALLEALGVNYSKDHVLGENVLEEGLRQLQKRLPTQLQVDQARLWLARAKVWMDLLGAVRTHAAGYGPLKQPSRSLFDKGLAEVATDMAGALYEELAGILVVL